MSIVSELVREFLKDIRMRGKFCAMIITSWGPSVIWKRSKNEKSSGILLSLITRELTARARNDELGVKENTIGKIENYPGLCSILGVAPVWVHLNALLTRTTDPPKCLHTLYRFRCKK